MSEEEISKYFISIDNNDDNPMHGKYSSKKESFYDDINALQSKSKISEFDIKPLQFTFEITNRCNCNCKDCGMAANRIDMGKNKLEIEDLFKIADDLEEYGIPSYAITGGEPFLEFSKMKEVINYSRGKVDVIKIISNGFWGKDVERYFSELEKSGLFENKYFIPSLQISIGEQDVPLEYIANIMNYVITHYNNDQIKLGIINTKLPGMNRLIELFDIYTKKYGHLQSGRIYLTSSYYVNSNPLQDEKLDVQEFSVYDELSMCENNFNQSIGSVVSPKIFMKTNGDAYPCEVFNLHKNMYLGNYFKDGLKSILDNYNTNKYVRFIKEYKTIGFRELIPKNVLMENRCEIPCTACEFAIKYAEKQRLLR